MQSAGGGARTKQRSGWISQWLTSSAGLGLLVILGALAGGYWVIAASRGTNGSADAIATIVVAVVGVTGTHIGHMTAHRLQKGSWRRREKIAVSIAAVVVLGLFAAIWAAAKNGSAVSPEALATLGAGVISVVGTHLGHVAGHQLGKEESARPDGQAVRRERNP